MSEAIHNDTITLARSFLLADIARVAERAKTAPLNEYQVHDAVAAAQFLGDAEVLTKAEELIPHTPRFHAVPPPEYPPLSVEQLIASIDRVAEHDLMLRHCLEADYIAALRLAECRRAIEDIAVTQACLGALSMALETSKHSELEDFR